MLAVRHPSPVNAGRMHRPSCQQPRGPALRRAALCLALLAVALVAGVDARAASVIRPGQERVVAAMLATGETLPGGCTLAGALVERQLITARFTCDGAAERVVELRHRDEVPDPAATTAQFALTSPDAALPPGFLAALEARVRANEARFSWSTPATPTGAAPDAGPGRARADPATAGGGPAHPSSASTHPAAPIPPPVRALLAALGLPDAAPYLLALALLLAVAASIRRPPPRRDLALAAALFASALTLRLTLGAWAPLHVNGQGPLWILGALTPALLDTYGPGYPELLGPLARLAPSAPDRAIQLAIALAAAATPALAYGLARAWQIDRPRAALAAVFLAVDPIGIWTAPTESYLPLITALTAAAAAALAAAVALTPSARVPAAALALAALATAAATARIHPAAWPALALLPLAALPAGAPRPLTHRLAATAVAFVLLPLALALFDGATLLATIDATFAKTLLTASAPVPPLTRATLGDVIAGLSLVETALIAAVPLIALFTRPRWLAVPALVALAACLTLRGVYTQSLTWQLTFDRLYLTAPAIALASALPPLSLTRPRLSRAALALAAAAALTAAALALPAVRHRTTDQLETDWLSVQFAALAEGCRVVTVEHADRRRAYLPTYRVPGPPRPALDITTLGDPRAALAGLPCAVWVHPAICSTPEGRPLCAAAESSLRLSPLAATTLPAAPSYLELPYDTDPIPIALSRILPAGL
jgi:hypothetical protein